ncbi:MAG: MopE-related protein, partial [Kofleriaceae bacterium]
MIRLGLISLVIAGAALGLSCNVNDYCLNCATGGDGGVVGDAPDADEGDGGIDGGDGGPCTITGEEVCDDVDNDCDGHVDEGPLPAPIGEPCDNQQGECAGGVKQCVHGEVTCSKPPMPELCDLKDNNCNGLVDEGDPGG